MRKLGRMLKHRIKGLGFALIVFKFKEPGISNYISNGSREDMIKALRECADRIERNQDINTPEEN